MGFLLKSGAKIVYSYELSKKNVEKMTFLCKKGVQKFRSYRSSDKCLASMQAKVLSELLNSCTSELLKYLYFAIIK
jgi:hypothetical protein